MSLSRSPGPWRWEDRGERGWWRVNDRLAIEDGPHKGPQLSEGSSPRDSDPTCHRLSSYIIARSGLTDAQRTLMLAVIADFEFEVLGLPEEPLPLSRDSGSEP